MYLPIYDHNKKTNVQTKLESLHTSLLTFKTQTRRFYNDCFFVVAKNRFALLVLLNQIVFIFIGLFSRGSKKDYTTLCYNE